jgi:hypothetical protein
MWLVRMWWSDDALSAASWLSFEVWQALGTETRFNIISRMEIDLDEGIRFRGLHLIRRPPEYEAGKSVDCWPLQHDVGCNEITARNARMCGILLAVWGATGVRHGMACLSPGTIQSILLRVLECDQAFLNLWSELMKWPLCWSTTPGWRIIELNAFQLKNEGHLLAAAALCLSSCWTGGWLCSTIRLLEVAKSNILPYRKCNVGRWARGRSRTVPQHSWTYLPVSVCLSDLFVCPSAVKFSLRNIPYSEFIFWPSSGSYVFPSTLSSYTCSLGSFICRFRCFRFRDRSWEQDFVEHIVRPSDSPLPVLYRWKISICNLKSPTTAAIEACLAHACQLSKLDAVVQHITARSCARFNIWRSEFWFGASLLFLRPGFGL